MRRTRMTSREAVENNRQLRSRIVQILNVPQRVRLRSSLAAALPDGRFEQLPMKATPQAFARCGLAMNSF